MKIITMHAFLIAATVIYAEPLKIVEAAPSDVSPEKSRMLHSTLQVKMPHSRISVQQLASLLDPEALKFLPDGQLFRVSAVVMDPKTLHGALLHFVVYEQGDKQIVMPMSGSHTEFSELLKLTGKKINGKSDALAASRSYSAIYGIKSDVEPEIDSDDKGFTVRILHKNTEQNNEKKNTVELRIDVDDEHNASKVEAKSTK